jgi:hypothetical protein
MRTLIATLALVGALSTTTAFAQGTGQAPVTVYGENAWTDDIVTGDLIRPDGELGMARLRARQTSLIQIRMNFVPEMLKSVETQ